MGDASTRDQLPGVFLEGSVGCNDPIYRDFCLASLRDLIFQGKAGMSEAAVRSLISWLKRIRRSRSAPLGIAQKLLPLQIDMLREVAVEMTTLEEQVRREAPPRQIVPALQMLHEKDHLLLVATLVPENRIRLLGAVQYALAVCCSPRMAIPDRCSASCSPGSKRSRFSLHRSSPIFSSILMG